MTENELSYLIIGKAIDLHRRLGPGLLEKVYEKALAFDLEEIGLKAETQVPVPMIYKEIKNGRRF